MRAVVRAGLSYYYRDGLVYRIPFGPLRGCRLRYRRGINYGPMLGLYEPRNFRLLRNVLSTSGILSSDATACDVGANIGLFSLWLARRAVPRGRVYAFEPAPETVSVLRDTVTVNGLENITVCSTACTDRVGPLEFFIGGDLSMSSVNAAWAGNGSRGAQRMIVDGTTLDAFFFGSLAKQPPAFIKMDIEGGGVTAVKGCARCVREARPIMLVESHNPAEDAAFGRLILENGYDAFQLNHRRWVSQATEVHPHPDGVWGTLLLCPAERRHHIASLL